MGCAFDADPDERYVPQHEFMCEEVYNYYLHHPDWHAEEKHGPERTMVDEECRQLNESNPDRFATHFVSQEVMEECRVRFLQTFEAQMNEAVQREHTKFVGTFFAGESVGVGIAGQEDAVDNVCLVTFHCRYEDSRWWEITAYPNLWTESLLSLEERMNFQAKGRSWS